MPVSPITTHSDADGHDTPLSRSSTGPRGNTGLHLFAPPVGSVETSNPPSVSITHSDVVGQSTFWTEPECRPRLMTFHACAPPVGSVEVAIRACSPTPPAVLTATHNRADGHEI